MKDHSDVWPDEGMFAPDETRAGGLFLLTLSRRPVVFLTEGETVQGVPPGPRGRCCLQPWRCGEVQVQVRIPRFASRLQMAVAYLPKPARVSTCMAAVLTCTRPPGEDGRFTRRSPRFRRSDRRRSSDSLVPSAVFCYVAVSWNTLGAVCGLEEIILQ